MRKDTLEEAVHEARRFIKRAADLKEFADKCDREDPQKAGGTHFNLWFGGMSARQASVRRSSLDLTKTLARLRQNK